MPVPQRFCLCGSDILSDKACKHFCQSIRNPSHWHRFQRAILCNRCLHNCQQALKQLSKRLLDNYPVLKRLCNRLLHNCRILKTFGILRAVSKSTAKCIRSFKQIFGLLTQKFATHCVANLSWTHVRLIMRLDNSSRNCADFRDFYSKKLLNGIVSIEK